MNDINLRKKKKHTNTEQNEDAVRNLLSDITVYGKYAKYIPVMKKREQWPLIATRNAEMHAKKHPKIADEIYNAYQYVLNKNVFPSMRSLQFAGLPIELSPNRMFNCAFTTCDNIAVFSETMFLLLGGSGVGYSVQKHHIEELPDLQGPKNRKRRYLVGDSIEGWADAIKVLMESYFLYRSRIEFDYRDIRPKGARLVTSGGKAPGPKPLKDCIDLITSKLDKVIEDRGAGAQLQPIEVHDIMCYIADAVLAGGIRRAALICLFSFDDLQMLACKSGMWWEENPQRGRANNSVVLVRHKITKENFLDVWKMVEDSKCGEPGIFFTNDKNIGCNPCCEIALKPNQFCNLTTINVSDIRTQEELNARVKAATLIGTLQASYTDFHYLRDVWRRNSERESLLGVSMTGIGSGSVLKLDLEEASRVAVAENKRVAKLIGINPAYRITCIKPEGTASLVAGTSSGVHAWHAPYYIRRMRLSKNEALYKHLIEVIPELIEDDVAPGKAKTQAVLSFPQKAPEGSIYRDESPIQLLDRVKRFHNEWIKPAHLKGSNSHNVSVTVSIKPDQWKQVGEWMWENRDSYNGISVLDYDGGTYDQAPFEDCTKEHYESMLKHIRNVDISSIIEEEDETDLSGELACSGGACEVATV
tara:strand:+ start:3953 stop:5884 length:1932 start_codon:yes stop_codon:yes gene_type:complete